MWCARSARVDLALRSRGHRFRRHAAPPSAEHWFGTDQYGRDVFSRIVYGSRTALAVGIISAIAGCTSGALVGAASGYFGGRIDNGIQRVVDIMLSFPIIVLAHGGGRGAGQVDARSASTST